MSLVPRQARKQSRNRPTLAPTLAEARQRQTERIAEVEAADGGDPDGA